MLAAPGWPYLRRWLAMEVVRLRSYRFQVRREIETYSVLIVGNLTTAHPSLLLF